MAVESIWISGWSGGLFKTAHNGAMEMCPAVYGFAGSFYARIPFHIAFSDA
ncbi:predicted protein [Sclerotinia sclerotiorum 1980 UF-70]|uniref:Uncharacterized protein n=1 Tax=Sclerotinia sclerotiorum (strain ATCC 18683 / 1980 / Ss-1) TaxID=665079 RepID=A7E8E3_SCLS1|nr:predicted protein [Sclerotinia sclerotiorum 1980 UF-70]EDN96645.1 predicted protein [Sclerotinia sclerotiorum 1980 UF-70]